jgi:hypothetical protein
MKTEYKTFEARVKAGLKGEAKLADIEADILAADILPLQDSKGLIDKSGPGFKALSARAFKVAAAWYCGEARVIDGKVYQPAELKAAIDKKNVGHVARSGALSGIRVKAFRWTGKLLIAHEAKKAAEAAAAKGESTSKAPSGKVAVALKRSKAAKGKPAAKPAAPASVPVLSEALRDAIAKLKPQSRIAAANQVMDYMRNIVSEARTAMDAKPRIAKPAKVTKAAAPAPVAVQ